MQLWLSRSCAREKELVPLVRAMLVQRRFSLSSQRLGQQRRLSLRQRSSRRLAGRSLQQGRPQQKRKDGQDQEQPDTPHGPRPEAPRRPRVCFTSPILAAAAAADLCALGAHLEGC